MKCWYCQKKERLKDSLFCEDCIDLKEKPEAHIKKKGRKMGDYPDFQSGNQKDVL